MNKNKLSFGQGNAKLDTFISTFSLVAGKSCPFAKDCLSMANRETGKITDGPDTKFRCFAASQEMLYSTVRQSRWHNFELLKESGSIEKMVELIQFSLPIKMGYIRVHVSGDFFSEKYFIAWLNVAVNNPDIIFYGYTKATPFLVKYKKDMPGNFRFTASYGGTRDNLIGKHKLKYAKVIFSVNEAGKLEIDHDDSHAISNKNSFALLLHGIQPAQSPASNALKLLKRQGLGSYGKGTSALKIKSPVKINIGIKGKELTLTH